jgi:peptidoglycan/xylan/chitin deacetylase (PgdA/CDA1 family)
MGVFNNTNLVMMLLLAVGFLVVVDNSLPLTSIYGEKKKDDDKDKDGDSKKGKDQDKEKETNHIGKFFEDKFRENKDYSEDNPLDFDPIPLSQITQRIELDGENNNKYVILLFDRGYKTTYTTAKPILDKYGFKASIFVVCEYAEMRRGLNWDQVRELYNDGYDIQSQGSEQTKLTEIKSPQEIESIISGGKRCLEEKGYSPTVFQVPFNEAGNDHSIVDTVAKYFDFAFIGHSDLMFLNCDGWEKFGYDKKNYYGTTNCSPYLPDGTLTPTNKFAMKEWSHDRAHHYIGKGFMGDEFGYEPLFLLFEKFAKIVDSQTKFNKNGEINVIPIIGYHAISRGNIDFTPPELFDLEMKYLYDNGFKVITLNDLKYDENQERFYINDIDTKRDEASAEFQNKTHG